MSLDRWVGKVAIVTGASSGIGAAIADSLARKGLVVAGIARRVQNIQERSKLLPNGNLHGIQADLTQESQVLDAFKWIGDNLGPVHVLVNSAGISKEAFLTEGVTQDWKNIFDVNVLALCVATRQAVKVMQDHNINGHIIHINSIFGHSVSNVSKVNVYPASKFAITALAETLRLELGRLKSKIKITSVSPGLVDTEMTLQRRDISEERRNSFQSRPILRAEDVADAVIYILSTPEHVLVKELTIKPLGEPC